MTVTEAPIDCVFSLIPDRGERFYESRLIPFVGYLTELNSLLEHSLEEVSY